MKDEDKIQLLQLAHNSITRYLKKEKIPEISAELISDKLKIQGSAFVTVYVGDELRGCIGQFVSSRPLYKLVPHLAKTAAFKDNRFDLVTADELDDLNVEISVLTPLKKIQSADEIIIGKHGIHMVKGFSTGSFLPQVATKYNWSREEFLGRCARDKARIGWDGWKDADLFVFETVSFSEKELLKP